MERYPRIRGEAFFLRDPDLPGLEIRVSRYEAVAFPRHAHAGYSLGLVDSGSSRVFLRGRASQLGRGHLALIHPEEMHACNPVDDGTWAYRMFHLDEALLRQAAVSLAGEGNASDPVFDSPTSRDPALLAALSRLHAAVASGAAPLLARESCLLAALAILLLRHADTRPRPALDEDQTRQARASRLVREALRARWAEPVRLAELAALTGCSEYAVLRGFQRATGFTPHGYQRQLRIARARELLTAGRSVVDVALATGYGDQAAFTRVFTACVGVTPGRYRRG